MEEVQQSGENEGFSDFATKIRQLESENKKMREEFNVQRAKLKDLYLQKEGELARRNKEYNILADEVRRIQAELDEAKSQLLVAGLTLESNLEAEKSKSDAEIATLQKLVHETVEESTLSRSESRKLQNFIQQLQREIHELKAEKQQSPHHTYTEPSSMAPGVMLSAVTKTIVRKLGADSFTSPDKVDDDHAQEDAEVLRSLVVPLEEEIKALKNKLRATDDQLQKCQQCGHNRESTSSQTMDSKHLLSTSTNTSFDSHKPELHSPAIPCDMCSNYEAQLVKEQRRAVELEANVVAAEKAAERHREELLKEIGFRKEMEEKWNEKKEEHKQQVAELTTRTECAEQDLKELQQTFNQVYGEVRHKLADLTRDREKVQQELDKLQKENDNLVGKYSIHSQELQSEIINLPDTVTELHELILKNHQELIIGKIGKEAAEEYANNLQSSIMVLKDQMTNDKQEKESLENSLVSEINSLRKEKDDLERERATYKQAQDKLENLEKTYQETVKNLQAQLSDANKTKKQFEDYTNGLKSQLGSLQQELDNSEMVQKDFVRLSQNLQVQLEKIRASDAQVRWQHEEDVEDCPNCRSGFSVTKRKKQHCRHCGQIFCANCLSHVVNSGPNQRPSKVCDVCHTLLVKSSAPYFSTEVPHSPD